MAIPQRKCFHPSCRIFIPFTQSYCGKHEPSKEYNRSRRKNDSEYVKFYKSAAWKNLRRVQMLKDDYLCQSCLSNGIYTPGDMVDHVVPTKEEWSRRLDENNLQTLCWPCHNTKTFKK